MHVDSVTSRKLQTQGRSWPGGPGVRTPPASARATHGICANPKSFFQGGYPLVKFGIADFTALFASLSVTFSDAVWRRHRTKVSAVC